MLKKLQSLKAKKGFTLVELIVVIAIIAVLAAILVPTMLGYVTSSRVTSADSTASTLKDTLGNAIVETDTKGNSVPRSGSVKVTASVDTSGQVTGITFDSGTYTELGNALKDKINNDYNFTKQWEVVWFVKDGKVAGCAYTAEGGTSLGSFTEAMFTNGKTSLWDTSTDGIMSNAIIGTSPKLIKS